MATTKLTNLLNPQVVGEYIDAKLVDKIKLSPLAIVGTELQGRPGNTLTVPTWQYVGEAIDLAEGVADVPVVLESDSETVTVKKAAKSVEITDEAGWTTTKTIKFEVTTETQEANVVSTVVGIVLAVVAVAVLAGVVVYFVVSKVKLDKELGGKKKTDKK